MIGTGDGSSGDVTVAPGTTTTVRNYALVENADFGVDVIALDSCTGLGADSMLFLHQTQAAGGALAGRYAYVTINTLTPLTDRCIVQLKSSLNLAFRTGESEERRACRDSILMCGS